MTVEQAQTAKIACIAQMAATLQAGDRASFRDWKEIPDTPSEYAREAVRLYTAVESALAAPQTET